MSSEIKHQAIHVNGEVRYLCNQACGTTTSKLTSKKSWITCKNCLREVKKWKKSQTSGGTKK